MGRKKACRLFLEELEPRLAPSVRPDHVVLVMEENHSFSEIIGSSSAPYINSLAQQGALMTNAFAIEHPSQLDYLDIFSGSNQGVITDAVPPPGAPYSTPNLASELIGAGLTFGGYSEDMPSVGFTGGSFSNYVRKHNPWVDFSNVPSADNMPYAGFFATDFTTLPTMAIVVPNLIHDMHDGTIQQGDTWLQTNIDAYAQWAKSHNSLLIVTWDEDDGTQHNQVATILVGAGVNPGPYGEYINHYNVLRTIEDMYRLPYAGNSAAVTPITDVFAHFSIAAPSTTTAGSSFSITITAQDANNNTLPGYQGTAHFTSADAAAILPADYTFTAADAGVDTFTGVILKTAGNQTIAASDSVTGSITGNATVMVNPAAAASLVVAGYPSPVTAGIANSFTVTAEDQLGNIAAGYTGTVHFASSALKAVVPVDYTFTAGDAGVHVFSAILRSAGSQSLSAMDTVDNSLSGSQVGIIINPAATNHLVLSQFPSKTTAGVSQSFRVTAQDAFGNTTPGYTGTVTFRSTDGQAVLPANYMFISADAGVHSFSATLKTDGSQSITATDTATSGIKGSQSGIAVDPAAASKLVVSGYSPSTIAGACHSFTVTAKDAFGNTASGYSGTVAFTSSDGQAVLPATYPFSTSDAGVHTFTATLNTTGAQAITATDMASPLITGTQSGITVSPLGAATTYYASLTGSDSNPGTLSQPFATINHAVRGLKPGDTLLIRAGTYAESLVNAIPGGISWSAPVTVAAYPGETVTLRPASNTADAILYFASCCEKYIIVQGLIIDASNARADAVKITWSSSLGASSHIRLQNDEIENTPNGMGILIKGDPSTGNNVDYNEIINCKIHNNGSTSLQHGIYISTSHNLIDGSDVYSNAGYGIHLYDMDAHNSLFVQSNVIRNCKVHDNSTATGYSGGIVIATGDNNLVYNNLVYNNTRALTGGIELYHNVNATYVLNNTVYNNDYFGITNESAATNSVIQNNIVYNNASGGINNNGTAATIDHNTSNSQSPMFVNPLANDFHLHAGSPTIDAGITLSQVPVDFDGLKRPQGPAYCIGAYEFPVATHLQVAATSTSTAGSSFSITVTAQDANNNTVGGYTGTVHWSSSDATAILPGDYTFTAADAGLHTFTGIILKTGGAQTITVTDTVTASVTENASVAVKPGLASKLIINAPSSVTQGVAFTFTVTALDAYGNVATGYTGTVQFSSSDAAASLPTNYTFTGSDAGVATFTAILNTTGSESLTVTDTLAPDITGTDLTIQVTVG